MFLIYIYGCNDLNLQLVLAILEENLGGYNLYPYGYIFCFTGNPYP